MRILIMTLIALALAASAVSTYAVTPNRVTLQGNIVCVSCIDVKTSSTLAGTPVCMAALSATDGMVYTLVPNTVGKDLESMAIKSPRVEVEGYLLPNSRIFEPIAYRPIMRFAPVPLEYTPWFNF